MTIPVIGIFTLECTDESAMQADEGMEGAGDIEAHRVLQAGGLPVLVPRVVHDPDHLRQLVEALDGVLLTCGEVDQQESAGPAGNDMCVPNPSTDHDATVEVAIVRIAVRAALPILGICRGAEVMDDASRPFVSAGDRFAKGVRTHPSPAEHAALIETLVRKSDPYRGLDPSWILSQQ